MTILEQGDILRYVIKRRLGSWLMKKVLLKSSGEGSKLLLKSELVKVGLSKIQDKDGMIGSASFFTFYFKIFASVTL